MCLHRYIHSPFNHHHEIYSVFQCITIWICMNAPMLLHTRVYPHPQTSLLLFNIAPRKTNWQQYIFVYSLKVLSIHFVYSFCLSHLFIQWICDPVLTKVVAVLLLKKKKIQRDELPNIALHCIMTSLWMILTVRASLVFLLHSHWMAKFAFIGNIKMVYEIRFKAHGKQKLFKLRLLIWLQA